MLRSMEYLQDFSSSFASSPGSNALTAESVSDSVSILCLMAFLRLHATIQIYGNVQQQVFSNCDGTLGHSSLSILTTARVEKGTVLFDQAFIHTPTRYVNTSQVYH